MFCFIAFINIIILGYLDLAYLWLIIPCVVLPLIVYGISRPLARSIFDGDYSLSMLFAMIIVFFSIAVDLFVSLVPSILLLQYDDWYHYIGEVTIGIIGTLSAIFVAVVLICIIIVMIVKCND